MRKFVDEILLQVEMRGESVETIYLPAAWFVGLAQEVGIPDPPRFFRYKGIGIKFTPSSNFQVNLHKSERTFPVPDRRG